jgi:hypothetical protein
MPIASWPQSKGEIGRSVSWQNNVTNVHSPHVYVRENPEICQKPIMTDTGIQPQELPQSSSDRTLPSQRRGKTIEKQQNHRKATEP